jgi:hypothetical protein
MGASKESLTEFIDWPRFPSSRFEDLFVAWLKCGPRSAISHETALALSSRVQGGIAKNLNHEAGYLVLNPVR